MKASLQGNLANQKYEASRNIERHLKIVSGDVPPTWETSRWRKDQGDYHFHKQKGRMVVEERRVNIDNQYMSERIHTIVNENRQEGTHQYAPGWRVGRGGTCIDCYPSEAHALTMRNMANAQTLARNFAKGIVEKSNVQVHRFINSAKSSYRRDDHADFYRRTRVVYKIFMDRTPVTSLHLGLVKMAKKNVARRNKVRAMHNAQIEASSPDAPDRAADETQPSAAEASGPAAKAKAPPRPVTAPTALHTGFSQEIDAFQRAEEQQRASTQRHEQRADKKVREVVDGIQKPEDLFTAKEVLREIRNRRYPWDASTNDNVFNSDRNDAQERKAYSIWQDVSPPPSHLNDRPRRRPQTSSGIAAQHQHSQQSSSPSRAVPASSPAAPSSSSGRRMYLDDRCPSILAVAASLEQEKERHAAQTRLAASASSPSPVRSFYAPSPQYLQHQQLQLAQLQQQRQPPPQQQRPSTTTPQSYYERQRPPLPLHPSSAGATPFAHATSPGGWAPPSQSTSRDDLVASSAPVSMAASPVAAAVAVSRDGGDGGDGGDADADAADETDKDAFYHQQRLRKLQALRKNVSFVENINVIEFDAHNQMTLTAAGAAQEAPPSSSSSSPDAAAAAAAAATAAAWAATATVDNASITSTISGGSASLPTSPTGRDGALRRSGSGGHRSRSQLSPIKVASTDAAPRSNRPSPKEPHTKVRADSRSQRLSPSGSRHGASPTRQRSGHFFPPDGDVAPAAGGKHSHSGPTEKRSTSSPHASPGGGPTNEPSPQPQSAPPSLSLVPPSQTTTLGGRAPLRRNSSLGFIYDQMSPSHARDEAAGSRDDGDVDGGGDGGSDGDGFRATVDGDNFVLNVEDILRALKPHDEFLLDFHIDIASRFPFFVRKDGLVSDVVEYDGVPLSVCDAHGHEVGVLPVKVAVMFYDVGYILSGGADTTNMFSAPHPATSRPFSAQSPHSTATVAPAAQSPMPSRPVSALSHWSADRNSDHGGFSPHPLHTPSHASVASFPAVSPSGQIRLPRLQRLSMTLASLRNHPVGLPTTAGVLVAVRVVSSPSRTDAPPEVLERGAYRDFTDAYGFTFLTVNQLLHRKKAFPRDASVLTVLHEMQAFAYPYSGIDQVLTHGPSHQLLGAHGHGHGKAAATSQLVNASTSRLTHLLHSGRSMANASFFAAGRGGGSGGSGGGGGVHIGSAGTESGVSGRRALAAGDKHRLSNAGVTAGGYGARPTSFVGQKIVTIDEGQKHAIVYPCLLDMCDAEAIDSLVQPILASLRLEYEEVDDEDDGGDGGGHETRSGGRHDSVDLRPEDVAVVAQPSPSALFADPAAGSRGTGHVSFASEAGGAPPVIRKKRSSIRETIAKLERGEMNLEEFEREEDDPVAALGVNKDHRPVHLTIRCL